MWDFDLYSQSLVWHVLEIKRVPSAFVWLVDLGMENRNLIYHQRWRYVRLVLIKNSLSIPTSLPRFKR